MSKSYYSGAVKAKRQSLADYFEQISSALDEINKISIADSWDCTNAKDASISLEDLKSKIGSIKTCMNSYLSFLGLVNKTYTETSDEISEAVRTYVNNVDEVS